MRATALAVDFEAMKRLLHTHTKLRAGRSSYLGGRQLSAFSRQVTPTLTRTLTITPTLTRTRARARTLTPTLTLTLTLTRRASLTMPRTERSTS